MPRLAESEPLSPRWCWDAEAAGLGCCCCWSNMDPRGKVLPEADWNSRPVDGMLILDMKCNGCWIGLDVTGPPGAGIGVRYCSVGVGNVQTGCGSDKPPIVVTTAGLLLLDPVNGSIQNAPAALLGTAHIAAVGTTFAGLMSPTEDVGCCC